MDIALMKNLKLLPTLLLLMVSAVSFAQKGTNMELWPKGAPNSNGDDKDKAELTVYLPDAKKATGRVVVCCPGGGYSHLAMDHEGHQWATFFNNQGIALVVLKYRMPHGNPMIPISDAEEAMKTVRRHAVEWHIDRNNVGIMGFSAGGHLASTAATTSGTKQTKVGTVDIDLEGNVGNYLNESSAVNAACDWSGPIDLTAMDCGESMKMGENSPEDVLVNSKLAKEPDKYLSLSANTYVDKNDPPIIIFHGEKDNVVPCCQGKAFFETLKAAGVKTEATFVPEGSHGGPAMYVEENLQKMVNFLKALL
jgi:acetyl esterase/lipase